MYVQGPSWIILTVLGCINRLKLFSVVEPAMCQAVTIKKNTEILFCDISFSVIDIVDET